MVLDKWKCNQIVWTVVQILSVQAIYFPTSYGPRDLGKYKLSSDNWKNWPLVKVLDFVKDVLNV